MNNMEAARQLYQPTVGTMTSNLPDLGESLRNAAIDLARACTVERVDRMVARLRAAEASMGHLRKAIIAERSTGHGTAQDERSGPTIRRSSNRHSEQSAVIENSRRIKC